MSRRLSTSVLVTLLLAACAPSGARPTGNAPAGSVSAAAVTPSIAAVSGPLVFLPEGLAGSAPTFVALAASSGASVGRLPFGVADSAWTVLYAAAPHGESTRISAYDPRSGQELHSLDLPGRLSLPRLGSWATPEGLTADGHTLVLVDGAPQAGESRFVLVDTALRSGAFEVRLRGSFEYDAVSPHGDTLYLIEHLDGTDRTHYQVRAYDVALGALRDGVIVDKRELGERMEGNALARSGDSGRWVYTLYRKREGALFVHALDTVDGIAFCIDLPATARGSADAVWALAAAPRLHAIFVADAADGLVARADLESFTAASVTRLAANGRAAGSTGIAGAAVAPDATVLYVADGTGLRALETAGMRPTSSSVPHGAIRLAVGSDGALYAVASDGGIVRLAAATS